MKILDRLLGVSDDPERELWTPGRRKFLFLSGGAALLAQLPGLPAIAPRETTPAGLVLPTLPEVVAVQPITKDRVIAEAVALGIDPKTMVATVDYMTGKILISGPLLHKGYHNAPGTEVKGRNPFAEFNPTRSD